MGRIFPNDNYRTRWIQALTFLLDEVDTGSRTPKECVRVIANQTGLSKMEVAAMIAGWTRFLSQEMTARFEDFLTKQEV